MNSPKISVVMSNYNTNNEYLKLAVNSILNQTFKDFELIIVDDASDNDNLQILEEYRDKRIKLIKNNKNLGLAANLNTAISLAKGEYIARMDTDDISMPSRLEKQFNYLEKHPDIGVLGTSAIFFGKRKRIKKMLENHEDIKSNLLFQNQLIHPSVMIRKELFELEMYNNSFKTAQDYELWSRLIWVTKFHNLSEILLKYRTHAGQITISKQNEQNNMANHVRSKMLEHIDVKLNEKEKDTLNKSTFIYPLEENELYELVRISNKIINRNKSNMYFDEKELTKAFSKNVDRANYIFARENNVKPIPNLLLEPTHFNNIYSVLKKYTRYYKYAVKLFGK